jgi:hypothetical protein
MGPQRLKDAWCAKVITLFPDMFPGVLGGSLTGKALQSGLWALDTIDLRIFGEGKHRNVDDTPAGGGAGLVLRPDILGRAMDMAANNTPPNPARPDLSAPAPFGFDKPTGKRIKPWPPEHANCRLPHLAGKFTLTERPQFGQRIRPQITGWTRSDKGRQRIVKQRPTNGSV